MNKKAQLGDQLYFVYFLFLLIIITVGIVIGSYSSFGKGYDSRKSNSELLLNQIVECLNEPVSETKLRELQSTCSIDQTLLEKGIIIHLSSGNIELFKYGDHIVCGLQDKYANGPKCTQRTLTVDVDGAEKEINLIVGSKI